MVSGEFDRALESLRASVDALLAVDVSGAAPAHLVDAITRLEVQRRRLSAVDQRLLAEAHYAGVPAACGSANVGALLTSVLRVDAREARARVARALDCGPRRALTGEPLPPLLPAVASAVAGGEISTAHADVILAAVGHLPPSVDAQALPVVEAVLVEAARHETPAQLRRTATVLLARLDPDGVEPVEDRQHRRRSFALIKGADGTSRPSGRFTAELTAYLDAVLDSLSAPRPADDEGGRDPRTAAQRRHDGLLEALTRLLRSGTLPATGGVPVTIVATTSMVELSRLTHRQDVAAVGPGEREAALASLAHGAVIPAATLLHWACEAAVVPVVFDAAGGVVAYGRTQRLASPGQRLALAARDGGCCFPGCDRPAAWCEAHHVIPWIENGPTDLDNLCLLCAHHHRIFEQAGWQVIMTGGVPEWIPPPWLDPDQVPRRNTVHHLPEIEFRRPEAA